jgi:hypothetical protein
MSLNLVNTFTNGLSFLSFSLVFVVVHFGAAMTARRYALDKLVVAYLID